MRLIDKYNKSVVFRGEDGETLRVTYDNRGEPYRQGIALRLEKPDDQTGVGVFIEEREVRELQDLLDKLYPRKK